MVRGEREGRFCRRQSLLLFAIVLTSQPDEYRAGPGQYTGQQRCTCSRIYLTFEPAYRDLLGG